MRAVALDYERRRLVERSLREPPLPAGGEVLFRVEQVGICATDRELAAFRFGYPPEGETSLVLGHEALGRVVAAGAGVRDLRPGDLVTAMIRRACPERCPACARGRRDLCLSGRYRERGIFGAHGYFTELAADAAEDLAAIPPGIAEVGVLAEPLSVVEKAIERACEIRGDRPASALVIGAGPIGMLAALALMARGAAVSLHSLEPRTHPRPGLASAAGARYLESLDATRDRFDLVVEAAGSAEAAFQAIRRLRPLGVCAILGGSSGSGSVSFTELLAGNQAVFGSVNASPAAFAAAVEDLARFDRSILDRMIRRAGFGEYRKSILESPDEVFKIVHVIH
ncbi:MAG: alcohol dehydrogenase catalytic domain-containing protein [Bryobacterales bacterium]|nr:alcohol dehydrogenase catalytic domain-containing protein [Bryobacterales bacterium]